MGKVKVRAKTHPWMNGAIKKQLKMHFQSRKTMYSAGNCILTLLTGRIKFNNKFIRHTDTGRTKQHYLYNAV